MKKENKADGLDEATLGGYTEVHERPPAFEGSDGFPYTVSAEIETSKDLEAPYIVYLVFPRWASTGLGITGHLQTPILYREKTREQAEIAISMLKLSDIKLLLEEGIASDHDD
ncbi:MAG: hypothetical protein CME22_04460 [Gemmatimonadetes bacterium]|jgi:hypothetical protein|nr:hypothetical protein [Gemmatimonadota bacterium]MCH2451779.1 hypothetical protein [Gemmatimonadota bacterium]|tara:strand:+ start:574 stop:912 length:339 start_codon:yes stop_codon:yes gene_type:complete